MLRNFFQGISVSQILAGALAAVTSFLLSARIGIAGSVIGVAVGSIVSAVASQIYRNMLKASGAKLQDKLPLPGAMTADESQDDAPTGDDTRPDDSARPDGNAKPGDSAEDTQADVIDSAATRTPRTASSSIRRRAEGKVQRFADLRRDANARRSKRLGIAVAVISALVAVGLTAGLILALTQGRGTDSVVRDIVTQHSTQTPTPSPTPPPDDTNVPVTPDSSDKPNATDGNGTDSGKTDGSTGSTDGSKNPGDTAGDGQKPSAPEDGTGTDSGTDGGTSGETGGTSGDDTSNGNGDNATPDSDTAGAAGSGTDGAAGQTDTRTRTH